MQRKEKNLPRVSVLMANYNGERFLKAAIESILSQSFTNFEMIVVDDGSTDKSVELLDACAKKDKRIRVFRFPKNRGFTRALNHGLGFCRGEYIARMDSDDLCHRDRLQKQVSYLDKHAEIHVLGCRYRAIDEEDLFLSAASARRIRKPLVLTRGRRRVAKGALLVHYPVLHPTIVCRRSTLLSVGGYREFLLIAEDDDLYARVVGMHGNVIDNLPAKLYYYRHYGSSTTRRFAHSLSALLVCVIGLSSEFRRRGFWDPLENPPSTDNRGLHFQGVSSVLFLQDSLVFLPYSRREGLYEFLRVVIILRRFGLKNFRDFSLWKEWGMTMNKQIYFYSYFCFLCFRLKKFQASFLYFCYAFSLCRRASFFTMFRYFFTVIFSLISVFIKFTEHRSKHHLFLFRSLFFTIRWHYGAKHFLLAFCYNPLFVLKFLVTYSFVSFFRFMPVFFRKLRV